MASTAKNRYLPRRATGATAYAALFGLAVLQLGLALHHDQHAATELTNTCVACVQLEQFDDAVAVAETGIVIKNGFSAGTTPAAVLLESQPQRPYHSRAPPVLS